MKTIFICLIFVLQMNTNAQTSISQKDFTPLEGRWTGTLT